jgi:hypothetical protein
MKRTTGSCPVVVLRVRLGRPSLVRSQHLRLKMLSPVCIVDQA